MKDTAIFNAFGGKESLVKVMDESMIGLVAAKLTKLKGQ